MKTVSRHYKAGNLNWPMIIYITLAHIAALIGLFTIGECHRYTLLWAFILWPIRFVLAGRKLYGFVTYSQTVAVDSNATILYVSKLSSGVGITGGVHRLWAHRSYKATFPLRVYLMLSNSIANQGDSSKMLQIARHHSLSLSSFCY